MGAVYMAEHPLIGKKVALKVLHAEFSANEDVVNRFFNEAKAVNDIQHPNIVDIIDYGVIPASQGNGMVYFIMEFLAGKSLASVIKTDAPLAPERALAISLQIADALGASHRKNIVHRDLKPDNVILVRRGRENDFVKVLDFGIAKLTGDHNGSRRTRTGIVMGTPAYMSPEQCEGKGNIDHRTDVYSLGCLLYETLTGRVPFVGEGYGEILVQHLTQPAPMPSTIRAGMPPHVELVCMKALEKKADRRYPNMVEFMKALSDPVGYVEAHGGLAGFMNAFLGEPTTDTEEAASQVMVRATTTTPVVSPLTPAPGSLTAVSSADEELAPAKSKTPLIAAAAAAVLIVGGGLAFMLSGGDKGGAAVAEQKTPTPAAAPAPVTPPVAAPAQPEMATVSVNSQPSGAQVWVAGESTPRGATPLAFQHKRGSERIEFTLKLEGYQDYRDSFVPDADQKLHLTLAKLEATRPSRGGRTAERGGGSSRRGDKVRKERPGGGQGGPVGDETLSPF
jgi:serine/threonine-protein kinase